MKKEHKVCFMFVIGTAYLIGFLLCLYPYRNGFRLDRQMEQCNQLFWEQREPVVTEQDSQMIEPEIEDNSPLAQLRRDAERYNARLFEEKQAGLDSPAAYEKPSADLADYGLSGEAFAVLTIPTLCLEMPVFLGAGGANLAAGAAHLSETSLPIGGKNTNCVIAGHRGWKGAAYFRDLPKLQIGDEVIITNLWEHLTYQVMERKVISSTETDAILIQPGKDLLTLMTCDYGANGIKNRYLVICERSK